MERALAGSFDRSLKFGHSSGIWQLNDKGWEDDHDHIDFDVSGRVAPASLLERPASCLCVHISACHSATSGQSCVPDAQPRPRCTV
jgi:hypothetical protein